MLDPYKKDGVDIDAGDMFSKYCNEINKRTYKNSPYVQIYDLSRGNFRGPKGFLFKNLPEGCIKTGGMDGIGTKVVLIVASGKPQTSASNVIAMTAMDITRWGGLPLLFMNIFDARSLGEYNSKTFEMCQKVMDGLESIAHAHQYVLFTGETAELGLCVGSENPDAKLMFNWGGCMLGVYHPNKMILGDTLRPRQIIMVLRDKFRSNGISSVRKALVLKYGEKWWNNHKAFDDICEAAAPSELYDRFLNEMHGWFNPPTFEPKIKMHLVVHLSGGAFKSKLGNDILNPLELAADLPDLFYPPEIMRKCAEWRNMNSANCYTTWNGGQGAAVVIDKKDRGYFVIHAAKYGIEAKMAGEIKEKKGKETVIIQSKFKDGEIVTY